ncbi:MAG: flagellar protein [Lachnospiraceae bacterium]|nr:flagellar protein [Lachnospiraceae bacterium]
MDVRNCRKCGRIFNYIAGPHICPACAEKMEEDFQKVKQYIRENPNMTIVETATACEVDVGQIKQWLREERLTLSSAEGAELVCESCGKPIMSGRFCEECKKDVSKGLMDSVAKPKLPPQPEKKESSGNKMRFLGR